MNIGSPLQKNNKLPNQPFVAWLVSQVDVLIGNALGLISTAYLFFALIYYSDPKHTEGIGKYLTANNIQIIIYWMHLIFIFYCVTKLIYILDDNKIGFYRTTITYRKLFKEKPLADIFEICKKIIKKFKIFFICFWVSMFFLYASFLFHSKWEVKYSIDLEHSQSITTPKQELDKTTNTETKAAEQKSIEPPINKSDIEPKNRSEAFYRIMNEFFIYTMNTISLMFVFWCFAVLYRPPIDDKRLRNQKIMIGFSICVTVVLIIIFPLFLQFATDNNGNYTMENLKGYVVFFDAISGVLNAVVLALLIARLDSKLVGLPSWLVGVLYIYAAVQPLFVVFEQSGFEQNIIKTFVLITVFVLKIYWFFIILYTFQTGRLLNYLVCFPTLNKKVDSIFQNQFEIAIKPTADSFIITKKTIPIYTTDSKFSDRDECEKEIELLMNQAKDETSYSIDQKRNGSYIVKIVDKKNNDKVLCISTDKTSFEEAEDLKFESMEKLPYCKFDYNKPA